MGIKSNKLGPGRLKIGETGTPQEFGTQCTATAIEPEVDEGDEITVLSGDTLEGDDEYTYNLTGTALQDYSGMTSWIVWCKQNQGSVLPFEFVPNDEAGLKVTGNVKIRPVKLGGTVKERNESDFEFKGIGDYTYAAHVPEG